jgi:hypothetical protein
MRLNSGEGKGLRLAGTLQETARIARTVDPGYFQGFCASGITLCKSLCLRKTWRAASA